MKIVLYVGGERAAVEINEANAIDARFEREINDNIVYKVDLSCRQWKRESLDIVAPRLRSNSKSVRFLNLADVIAGLMTEEGLGVTQLLAETFESSDLLEIDLSDNAMGKLCSCIHLSAITFREMNLTKSKKQQNCRTQRTSPLRGFFQKLISPTLVSIELWFECREHGPAE